MANAAFYYVDGDRNKTPVDLASQPVGTALVLVTPQGRDVHFIVGKKQANDPTAIENLFHRSRNSGNHEG